MINDVNNLLLRERGAVTKARPQQFYVCVVLVQGLYGTMELFVWNCAIESDFDNIPTVWYTLRFCSWNFLLSDQYCSSNYFVYNCCIK